MSTTQVTTFLFSDIEGSTARWEEAPAAMRVALDRHDEIMLAAIDQHDGTFIERAGDSFVAAFEAASDALAAAITAQHGLQREPWPAATGALMVRMALHTGDVEWRPDGMAAQHTLSRQSRLLAIAHGGQVVLSGAAHDAIAGEVPEGVGLRDLGTVWLKDLVEPERVFQVVADQLPWSLPSEFPPLRNVRVQGSNLPTASIPFVGRRRPLDEVSRAVTEGSSRVVTLLGPGGIGKTRLALRVAERVQHRFAGGVYFVDLAAITEPAQAMRAVATAVGIDGDVADDPAVLAKRIGDSELLLVLDNLEQVIDVAVDIGQLLTRVPHTRVLATSRIPLRILEETPYSVESLDVPVLDDAPAGMGTTAALVAGFDAVQLFVARSTASRPDFELTDDNAAAVASICQRLEGVPLALVLAAARSRELPPGEMLGLLDHRLGTLTDGPRDLPRRHQALHDTIEWSFDLLDSAHRALYTHLAVFVGGFTEGAAAAVVDSVDGVGDVAAGLAALVDASLVVPIESPDGSQRFRMLETISEHARAKLDDAALDGVALSESSERRHAHYFTELAVEAARGSRSEHIAEWADRLDEEHDNIRAALDRLNRWADGGAGDAVQGVARVAAAMGSFWLDRGYLAEADGHLQRAAELADRWRSTAADDAERSAAWRADAEIAEWQGLIARRRDRLAEAAVHLERAVTDYRTLGDRRGEGEALVLLGTISFHRGDHSTARRLYSDGLALFGPDDLAGRAAAIFSLGNLERDAGNHERASSLYEQSLAIDVEAGDVVNQSVALNNLANLALDAGDTKRSRQLHLQSLALRERVGARIMLAESVIGIASVDLADGHMERAATLIGFAEGVVETLGGAFDPMERRLHGRAVDRLQGELAAARFGQLRQSGREMTVAAAVAVARGGSE